MTTELFRQYRQNPSRQLRDCIFNQHYKLAHEIAHQFRMCNLPFEDLLQLTSIGLLTAIERFDPSKGFAFSSFACPYMRGEIYHFIRDKSALIRIPRSLQSLYQRGRKLQDEAKGGLTDKQTAIALGVDICKWQDAKAACANHKHISLDKLLRNTAAEAAVYVGDRHIANSFLSIEQILSTDDKQPQESITIQPLPLTKLDQPIRQLLEMLFFENRPFKEVRKSAIASGIKAKDVKPLLINAVLSLV